MGPGKRLLLSFGFNAVIVFAAIGVQILYPNTSPWPWFLAAFLVLLVMAWSVRKEIYATVPMKRLAKAIQAYAEKPPKEHRRRLSQADPYSFWGLVTGLFQIGVVFPFLMFSAIGLMIGTLSLLVWIVSLFVPGFSEAFWGGFG
ncbi:MAG: hypothetical protein OXQ86_03180 [Gammaproteobacteria bacterium]|nr:hypothetical protein [Gammaproteobacteria bacterium]MDE0414715.1 hypothetical protein [Gammaproteobacteria bacterium]